MEKLALIIKELKAPKNQYNSFGKYKYRSTEDILEAVKPLLDGAILTIADEIVMVGDRYYVKATATFQDKDFIKSVSAFARESNEKKGMDESQITGSASSYARKYALNGLFCIDDTKDADSLNNTTDNTKKDEKSKIANSNKETTNKQKTPEQTAELKYIELLKTKGVYSDVLHLNFNKMNMEQKREEFKRVQEL